MRTQDLTPADLEAMTPQMRCYHTMTPKQYANTARLVDVSMMASERIPCSGSGCDVDYVCDRHRRFSVERYVALTERWKRVKP